MYTSCDHYAPLLFRAGKGVEKDHSEAMKWFKKAADQGHPHSSYNLAVGHLQGLHQDLQPGYGELTEWWCGGGFRRYTTWFRMVVGAIDVIRHGSEW